MSEPKAAGSPLKAVFFMEDLPMLSPLIAAWTRAGHEIPAIVMLDRHNARLEWHVERLHGWLTPQWSLPTQVRLHARDADILRLASPVGWESLKTRLSGLGADVLISSFFPRRIPETLLSIFPNGGVNLHPALLPHFRGPSPLHHLLLQDAWHQYGGVTLHRMSAGLDEGGIIASAKVAGEHWRNRPALNRALAGAMANLVGSAIPAYCRGEVREMPQPQGDFAWAGQDVEMTVGKDWHAEQLRRLLSFFGVTPGVYLSAKGKWIRLGSAMTVVGPPSGEPTKLNGGIAEFDLRDARVTCTQPPWLEHCAATFGSWLARRASVPADIPFSYANEAKRRSA